MSAKSCSSDGKLPRLFHDFSRAIDIVELEGGEILSDNNWCKKLFYKIIELIFEARNIQKKKVTRKIIYWIIYTRNKWLNYFKIYMYYIFAVFLEAKVTHWL